ncbi:MAG: adenylate/guanylate cyclase domain-containing protein [Deltaproteobacteria bacterium]|nr:MAG: adenylate/guanylate cyclase domain-containing protein [Deltaproteobacteria bacterium]
MSPGVNRGVWLGAVLGLVLALFGVPRPVERALLDQLQVGRSQAEPAVVLVELDARTTEAHGWPIPPDIYAAAVMRLLDAGAEGMGFDVVFASRTGGAGSDELFGLIAAEAGVVGAGLRLERAEAGVAPPPTVGPAECGNRDPRMYMQPLRRGLEGVKVAHVVAPPDVDGVHRRIEACLPVHDGCVPDLGAAVAGVRECGEVLVPMSRAREDFPRISLYELIEADDARLKALVDGRYVLFGPTDRSLGDYGALASAKDDPLMVLHANRLQALVEGRRVLVASWASCVGMGGLIAVGLLFIGRRNPRGWLGLTVGLPLVATAGSVGAFVLADVWVMPLTLALPPAIAALGGFLDDGARELRMRQMVEQAFGTYVSPDVLSWLQATQGAALDASAAEERVIAVLFSDVVGYTALSERLGAEGVVSSLRLYLGAMVPVIQKHGGYLDKINGDGLMVLFGAPGQLDDPAASAVACAREMLDEVEKMQSAWQAKTGADLQIRVGVATGPAIVGNLGAEGHVEYTAIGPTVNLAARLESAAPKGGLLVCDATHEALGRPPSERVTRSLKGFGDEVPAHVL